jgi:hypothetical protein
MPVDQFADPLANPYQTPKTIDDVSGASKLPQEPFVGLAAVGGGILKALITLFVLSSHGVPIAIVVAHAGSDLFFGALGGMGLALLVRAFVQKSWSKLAPGHWLAIEWSCLLIGELITWPLWGQPMFVIGISAFSAAQMIGTSIHRICAAAFYGYILARTEEKRFWRVFAWLCLTVHLVRGAQIILGTAAAKFDQLWMYLTYSAGEYALMLLFLGQVGFVIAGFVQDRRESKLRQYSHFAGFILLVLMMLVRLMGYTVADLIR